MEITDTIPKIRQSCTHKTLYNTMHISHIGYRYKNQGIAVACDWLHLLRDKRGVAHNPWTDTPISVIEVGCGNGKLCNLLSSLSFDVTGTDIFDNEAVYDRTAYKFVQHDLMKTPYPFGDNEFDYCLSFDVLEHLTEEYIAPVLQEMARISPRLIIKVSCTGEAPLHLTVKSPGWWLNQLMANCPNFSWQLVRNYERAARRDGDIMRSLPTSSDIRPFTNGDIITYAPLFYGKRGVLADEH